MSGADPGPSVGRISRDQILHGDQLLGFWLNQLSPLSARSLLFFLAVALLPLAVLASAAAAENRFFLGSMDCRPAASPGLVFPGMSFLGDSMVWPFALLIPCAFALLSRAVTDLEAFFRYPERFLHVAWLAENGPRYEALLADVRTTFSGRSPGWRRLRTGAIGLGLLLFVFNAVTCTLPLYRPQILTYYRPYTAPLIASPAADRLPLCPAPAMALVPLEKLPAAGARVPVQKWDTQLGYASLSWTAARLWILLLGYAWLPLLGYKVCNLIVGLRLYIRTLTLDSQALQIQPLSPDGAGGLSVLSTVAFSLVAPLSCFGLMLSLIFVKEHSVLSAHDLLLFVLFVPVVLVAFYLPLLSVHAAMKACKDKQLTEFSLLFNSLNHRLLGVLRTDPIDTTELSRFEAALRSLRDNYERLLKMPVWPFGVARLFSLISAIVATILPLFIQTVVKKFLHFG
jgi:hypothetical protein